MAGTASATVVLLVCLFVCHCNAQEEPSSSFGPDSANGNSDTIQNSPLADTSSTSSASVNSRMMNESPPSTFTSSVSGFHDNQNEDNTQRRSASYNDQRSSDYNRFYTRTSSYDNNRRLRPQQINHNQRNSYSPLVRSFQAISYVQDDLPLRIFFLENRNINQQMVELPRQTATVTEQPSSHVRSYFDEHDKTLGLTKNEEHMKIFYENNPLLTPIFTHRQQEEVARKKRNKLFNYYKTQRANALS